MPGDFEFSIDDLAPVGEPSAPEPPAPKPAPTVIIETRDHGRGLISVAVPPLLILLAAGSIVVARERTAQWERAWAIRRLYQDLAARPAPAEAAEPVASKPEPRPIVVKAAGPEGPDPEKIKDDALDRLDRVELDVPPEPTAAVPPKPEKTAPPNGFDPPRPEPPGPRAPKADPDLVAVVDPKFAAQEIDREAARKRLEKERNQRLAATKPGLLDRNDPFFEEFRRKTESDRLRFRAELSRIVARNDTHQASVREDLFDRIDGLATEFGRDIHPEIEQRVRDFLKKEGRALAEPMLVQSLRRFGLPEQKILDVLANRQMKNVKARNGPRDRADALIRAARQLLAIRPTYPSPRPTAVRRAPPPSRPAPAS